MDTGPIIAQEAVAIGDGETEESLHERIKVVERRLLVSTLASLAAAQQAPPAPGQLAPPTGLHGPGLQALRVWRAQILCYAFR